jgi:hypothetical protein
MEPEVEHKPLPSLTPCGISHASIVWQVLRLLDDAAALAAGQRELACGNAALEAGRRDLAAAREKLGDERRSLEATIRVFTSIPVFSRVSEGRGVIALDTRNREIDFDSFAT